jgi:hypothetical protein
MNLPFRHRSTGAARIAKARMSALKFQCLGKIGESFFPCRHGFGEMMIEQKAVDSDQGS